MKALPGHSARHPLPVLAATNRKQIILLKISGHVQNSYGGGRSPEIVLT